MGLQIDVVSDIVCPWCFIGKRRLHSALAQVQGPRTVRWHPMQLYPDVPQSGTDLKAYLDKHFDNRPAVNFAMEQLRKTGLQLGIKFDFENISKLPNTLDAHRLILSADAAHQDTLVEKLFMGFFEQARDLSDRDVLLEIAADSGLDSAQARRTLADEHTLENVLAEEQRVKKMGLAGLPNFLVNKSLAVAGAQDPATLLQAFDYALFGAPEPDAQAPTLH